jgi:C1A family cysteine protease
VTYAPVVNVDMPPVLDQGNLGSCTANAVSNVLRRLLPAGAQFQPSRLYQYYNSRVLVQGSPPADDSGCSLRDACKAVARYHACDEALWPYDIARFAKAPPLAAYQAAEAHSMLVYKRCQAADLRDALSHGHAVLIGVQLYPSVRTPEVMQTGKVPLPDPDAEQPLGGHALVLCGYNDATQEYRVQNSWGAGVGDKGFFYLPYDYLHNPRLAGDFWVITQFG